VWGGGVEHHPDLGQRLTRETGVCIGIVGCPPTADGCPPVEADPHDLLMPFPPKLTTMWPISTRVNSPRNDEPSILEPLPPTE
jgi:hypothetical protein